MIDEYKKPVISISILFTIIVLCYSSPVWLPGDPAYMYLNQINLGPGNGHLFGTDTLGRDVFKMVWNGGIASITIGILATLISSFIAVIYGTVGGISTRIVDNVLIRATDILLSVPSILLVIFIQAILGKADVVSISVVIGLTSWMGISRVVRSEVHRLKSSDYILSSRLMGAKLPYIIRRHLIPNFVPSIMFMVVRNIGAAMITEATLSFMGLGLPIGSVSWGSMMTLSEKALLTGSWWIIIIPGLFLAVTIVCITNIGEYMRSKYSIRYIT